MVAISLLLMCRPVITICRKYRLGEFVPVDNHVFFHKLTASLAIFFGAFHGICHLVNIKRNLQPDFGGFAGINNITMDDPPLQLTYAEWLMTAKPGVFGLIPGWAMPTGVALTLVMTIIAMGAIPWIRRKGHFEVNEYLY